jgi:hypothetical protein
MPDDGDKRLTNRSPEGGRIEDLGPGDFVMVDWPGARMLICSLQHPSRLGLSRRNIGDGLLTPGF